MFCGVEKKTSLSDTDLKVSVQKQQKIIVSGNKVFD